MRLEHYAIGVVVFGLFITVGYNLFLNQTNAYDLDADPTIFSSELINASIEETDIVKDSIREDTQTQEVSDEDTESSLYKSGYPAALSIFDSNRVALRALERVGKDTGLIEPYIIRTIIIILGILAGVFMLYMIFRYQPR